MSEYIRPRGTRDFGPDEMKVRRGVESRMRRAIELFGYEEIATPTFEHSDLFVARSGPQILEQIYNFKDKGGRDIVLRPELTAPVMRFYSTELRNHPKPLRIYYFGNCFRYERPQKGRFREFWQLGLEYIGKRSPLALSEVINSSIAALDASGLSGYQVRIGHVTILSSILSNWNVDKQNKELMIAIDKKDRQKIIEIIGDDEQARKVSDLISNVYPLSGAKEVLEELISTIPSVDPEPVEELLQVLELILCSRGEVIMDPSITRGLDYYDGIVFEIDAPTLGAEKQICGGGAYSLSEVLGKEVEGIGYGIGFDRVLVALGDTIELDQKESTYYLIPMGEKALKKAPEICSVVRDVGHKCILETSGRNLKKSLNNAISAGATHLLIIGDDEIGSGKISIKDLDSKEQVQVEITVLKNHLQ